MYGAGLACGEARSGVETWGEVFTFDREGEEAGTCTLFLSGVLGIPGLFKIWVGCVTKVFCVYWLCV